ncbi:MAG: iron-sulfur cluster assembly scaffold protein [Gemmatimonadota bacterium]|nr:MAG: iron-sulfur cluster assembly scaffold protein [Gemmatimonadota bacterium]
MQRNYSHTVIDHAMNPRNIGKIEGAEGHARFTGPCGDIMEIFLRIQNNVITEVSFMTDGCGTSLASGSMVTELVKRKHIQAAYRINQKNVLEALGGLPEEDEHCALLAASTMKLAVQDYLSTRNHLWKRMYKPGERS